jgi:hypothetical protein
MLVVLSVSQLINICFRGFVKERSFYPSFEFQVACLSLMGYLLLYTFNSHGIQNWYSPILSFLSSHLLLHVVAGLNSKAGKVIFSLTVLLFLFSGVKLPTSPYEHQIAFKDAGKYLSGDPGIGIGEIGAWNAGVMNWYSMKVTNLDGLVNHQAASAIKNNSMDQFLKKSQVKFVIDLNRNFEKKELRAKSGLRDSFFECLLPYSNFPMTPSMVKYQIRVYSVDKSCIS